MIGVHHLERLARQSLYADWLAALRELHEAEHELAELGPESPQAQARWEAATARVRAIRQRAIALGGIEPVPVEPPAEVRLMDRVMGLWLAAWALVVLVAVAAR